MAEDRAFGGGGAKRPGSRVVLMQGNEAIARAAIDAGCRFFAGYPITPSTEIAEAMAYELPRVGGKFIQMEDEIGSIAAVIGASLAGVKAMTATSGPGFSLMQENIGFAAMAEVPCVVVDVQRMGPSTGLPTSPSQGDVMQARWGTHGDHPVVALCPSSVAEAYTLTVEAFNVSERLRIPAVLLADEVIAHMRERVDLTDPAALRLEERPRPTVPPEEYRPYSAGRDGVPGMAAFGTGYRYHVTGLAHDETGFPTTKQLQVKALIERLSGKVQRDRPRLVKVQKMFTEDAEYLVVAYGITARSAAAACRAAREEGIRAGLVRIVSLWPFPDVEVAGLAAGVRAIVVPEMNLGQVVLEVERAAAGRCRVVGYSRVDGEPIDPGEILAAIRKVL